MPTLPPCDAAKTYAGPCRLRAAYGRCVCLPGVQRWVAGALAEHDFLDFENLACGADRPAAGANPRAKDIYLGYAVRDALLGLPVHDRDWVVVGSTPEAMQARGFVPVGKDFPVFLHPVTHEEHALAHRTQTAPGYHGFVVHARRDAGRRPGPATSPSMP